MDLKSISEAELWDSINDAFDRMTLEQRRVWDVIKIHPEKWQQEPWGNESKGFWVVAIIGSNVIWFNDIEDGYNQSTYTNYGTIEEYYCNQDELEWAVQNVINMLKDGHYSARRAGEPQPIA